MISRIRHHYFTVRYFYENPIDRQRARLLLVLIWAIVFAAVAWFAFLVVPRILRGQTVDLLSVGSAGLAFLASYFIYRFIQRGLLRYALWLFIIVLVIATSQQIVTWTEFGPNFIPSPSSILIIPLVAAGILLSRRGTVLVAIALAIAAIFAGVTQHPTLAELSYVPVQLSPIQWPIVVLVLGVVLLFLLGFVGSLERTAQESLAQNQQREWIAQFNAELSQIEEEDAVLSRAVSLIGERLGYLLTRVFIVEEDGSLSRSIRKGHEQPVVAESTTIQASDASLVSEVARSRIPTAVTTQDIAARRSHMLAAASVAAAIPIINGGDLLGILDIQNGQADTLTESEIRLLALLASEIGIALGYTTKIIQLRRALREQENASGRLQYQLQEFRQRERHLSSDVWGQYVQGRGARAIGYDLEMGSGINLVAANDLPETIYNTLKNGQLHIETVGDEQVINVPIIFRNTTLGAMCFTVPRNQAISERQLEMAQVVAERLALALENTRLFEQSQAQASRERKANEVGSVLIGATDVRALLNLAAEQFNEALGAVHTQIFIQPDIMAEPLARTETEAAKEETL